MLKRILLRSIKRHPVAVTMYSIYIAIWLCLCILTYYFLINDDADTLQGILFYWCMCICIPYLVINIILSYQIKKHSSFYKDMANLVFIPMGILLLIFAEHGAIAYFNKGM